MLDEKISGCRRASIDLLLARQQDAGDCHPGPSAEHRHLVTQQLEDGLRVGGHLRIHARESGFSP